MKQGIVLASGLGSRKKEMTKVTPKSLIEINGQPILERNIEFMIEAGIERIVIIVGYLKEEFKYLKEKYSEVHIELVYNPEYANYNTIYSMYCARQFFDCDSYVTMLDVYLQCNIFKKYEADYSFYLLKDKCRLNKGEWVPKLDEEQRIVSVSRHAYEGNEYTGVSYWKKEDMQFIREKLEQVDWNDSDVRQQYWDEIILPDLKNFVVRARILEDNSEIYEADAIGDLQDEEEISVKISFQDICLSFGSRQLFNNVNFDILKGEIFVLVGPSGSGKSTLLKMINKMVLPTTGKVLLDSNDISEKDTLELRRKMGYMMQKVGLFPHMTCKENILLPFELRKESPDESYIEYLTQKMDLTSKDLQKYPSELSGGEKQRVGLIRALAGNPELVLMDEPFSALDPVIRKVLQELILDIHRELNKNIIFVTHDMDEALKLANRILFIKSGKIEQIGTPYEIIHHPKNSFVAEFFERRSQ